jgi:hypothetical protein
MRVRAAESDVVKFLRAALADGAHAVTKLEASARAAGLLNERQRITHARAFRQAKKSLRIRSLRAGFGSRSQWLWELPRENERSARAERKPALLHRIPSDWIEGIACLNADRPPTDVPRHRWRQFVNDCTNFLSSESWAEHAAKLGWDAIALFGCAPRRPLDYSGSAGLLWAVNGGKLVELHRDWAVIDVPVQARQRIFYRRNVEVGKIRLPWVEQPARRECGVPRSSRNVGQKLT